VRAFSYQQATSLADAARLLNQPSALPLGGGTDLLVCVQDGLATPNVVVDLRAIAGSDRVQPTADGGLRVGASARIHDLATNAVILERYAALAQACATVGSPALRHMGTIGGNLCQRPRCWYLRRGLSCYKNGGSSCLAERGENQYHAILDGGPCNIVHPSDPAVALLALGASVETRRGDTARVIAMDEFFVLPRDCIDQETVLEPGEFVTEVVLPGAAAGARQFYRKVIQRGAWDFALASVAGARRADGTVRMALGGVAPRPWRVPESVEEDVASGGLDEDSVAALAERALYDVKPLSRNGYKVHLAASLLRNAMRELSA
jgi:xanthine dehydrogenase YagS FAD-binding subunit